MNRKISALVAACVLCCCAAYYLFHDDRIVVYDVGAARFIGYRDLQKTIPRYRVLLVGEEHLHSKHHAIQEEILNVMLGTGRLKRVVMEMIYPEQQIYIDRIYSGAVDDDFHGDHLPYLLKWKDQTWPWSAYRRIVSIAINGKIELVHGNISTERADAIRYGQVRAEANGDSVDALISAIDKAHWGLGLDEGRDEARAAVHSAIDRTMAANVAIAPPGKAVLFAGSTHVRNDIGVGKHFVNDESVASIGLLSESKVDKPFKRQPYDYVVVTYQSNWRYLYASIAQIFRGDA